MPTRKPNIQALLKTLIREDDYTPTTAGEIFARRGTGLDRVATPTFDPVAGTYVGSQTVTIATTTADAVIHYTTDGSTPTASSPTYSAPITVGTSQTVKAVAVKTGMANSYVGSAAYVIQARVATPTFDPVAGTYDTTQNVAIACATPGATIHYTTDGSPPTADSPTYSTPIEVAAVTTIRAIAVANGFADSVAATVAYVISVAPPGALFWDDYLSDASLDNYTYAGGTVLTVSGGRLRSSGVATANWYYNQHTRNAFKASWKIHRPARLEDWKFTNYITRAGSEMVIVDLDFAAGKANVYETPSMRNVVPEQTFGVATTPPLIWEVTLNGASFSMRILNGDTQEVIVPLVTGTILAGVETGDANYISHNFSAVGGNTGTEIALDWMLIEAP
jgi:hypothetical protein